jgi:hypothetical protein
MLDFIAYSRKGPDLRRSIGIYQDDLFILIELSNQFSLRYMTQFDEYYKDYVIKVEDFNLVRSELIILNDPKISKKNSFLIFFELLTFIS